MFAARPAAISFEAANPRHAHEWTVFEDVKLPEGKVLIPGVLDSTTNYIEHPELVAQRIVRYAELVGRENVIAGTDCGFGTFVGSRGGGPPDRLGEAGGAGGRRAPRLAAVSGEAMPPSGSIQRDQQSSYQQLGYFGSRSCVLIEQAGALCGRFLAHYEQHRERLDRQLPRERVRS